MDPQYHGNRLNSRQWDPIIEKEIIQLVEEEYQDLVLMELAEYENQEDLRLVTYGKM